MIPNDMKCHLANRGNYEEYTKSNEQVSIIMAINLLN